MLKVQIRPRLIPTICTLILVPILAALGMWQLDRAKQKTEIQIKQQSRYSAPPIELGVDIALPQDIEFYPIRATGSWDETHQFYLDNRILAGRAGYHVITPLLLQDAKTAVLVNRGWILASPDRSELPAVAAIGGETTVTGIAVVPPADVFQLEEQAPIQGNWESVWQSLDLVRFDEAVPYSTMNFVLQLNNEHPDGFERRWNPPNDKWILRHKAYAFQWFALCATLLVIYCLLTFRPIPESNSEQ